MKYVGRGVVMLDHVHIGVPGQLLKSDRDTEQFTVINMGPGKMSR